MGLLVPKPVEPKGLACCPNVPLAVLPPPNEPSTSLDQLRLEDEKDRINAHQIQIAVEVAEVAAAGQIYL